MQRNVIDIKMQYPFNLGHSGDRLRLRCGHLEPRHHRAGDGRGEAPVRWHTSDACYIYDTYKASAVLPWSGQVDHRVHWLCVQVSCEESRGESRCWRASKKRVYPARWTDGVTSGIVGYFLLLCLIGGEVGGFVSTDQLKLDIRLQKKPN